MFKTEKEYRDFINKHKEFCEFAKGKWLEYAEILWPGKCVGEHHTRNVSIEIDEEDGSIYSRWYDGHEDTSCIIPDCAFYDNNWENIVIQQIELKRKAKEEKEKKYKEELDKFHEEKLYETYQKLKAKFEEAV